MAKTYNKTKPRMIFTAPFIIDLTPLKNRLGELNLQKLQEDILYYMKVKDFIRNDIHDILMTISYMDKESVAKARACILDDLAILANVYLYSATTNNIKGQVKSLDDYKFYTDININDLIETKCGDGTAADLYKLRYYEVGIGNNMNIQLKQLALEQKIKFQTLLNSNVNTLLWDAKSTLDSERVDEFIEKTINIKLLNETLNAIVKRYKKEIDSLGKDDLKNS